MQRKAPFLVAVLVSVLGVIASPLALLAATAGTASLTTTPTTIFDVNVDGFRASTFAVTNESGSAGNALVYVAGIMKSGDWYPIPPGGKEYFSTGQANGIYQVQAKAVSTATIDFGPVRAN